MLSLSWLVGGGGISELQASVLFLLALQIALQAQSNEVEVVNELTIKPRSRSSTNNTIEFVIPELRRYFQPV